MRMRFPFSCTASRCAWPTNAPTSERRCASALELVAKDACAAASLIELVRIATRAWCACGYGFTGSKGSR